MTFRELRLGLAERLIRCVLYVLPDGPEKIEVAKFIVRSWMAR